MPRSARARGETDGGRRSPGKSATGAYEDAPAKPKRKSTKKKTDETAAE